MKQLIFIYILFVSIIGFSQDSLRYYNKQIKNNSGKERNVLFQKKINYLKRQDNLEEYFYAHFDYFILNPRIENIFILAKAEQNKWRTTKTEEEKLALLHLKINIAYHYLKYSNIPQSVLSYENALQYYKTNNLKSYNIIEYCLKPLANNYTRLGDYDRANDILKYTLFTAKNSNNKKQIIDTYLNLSIAYQSLHKNEEAIHILKKALQIKPITVKQKGNLWSEIGKNYYELSNYNKAHFFIHKSNLITKDKATIQKNYLTKALCFFKEKQINKAEKLFNTALKYAISIYGKNNREVAKIYILLAETNMQKNKYNKAQKNYQKALQSILTKYHPKTIFDNPNLAHFYAENTIKIALDGRAMTFVKQKDYSNAITNYNLAFEAEKQLQNSYTSQQSKIIQQSENRKRSEKIISLYYHLYQTNLDKKYIELAFRSTEKSKAIVLSDILNTKFIKQSLKKDTLLLQEVKLRKEKAILTKNINLEEQKIDKANIQKIKHFISKRTVITSKLQLLKQKIQQKYPSLTVNLKPVSVQEVQQNLLQKKNILIEFFDTKNFVYIFSINKYKPISWRRIRKDLKYQQTLTNYISLFNENGDKLKNDISIYHKSAYYLYLKLLQIELEKSDCKSLTIIPDGKLNFVSFDALLTKKITHTNFEKMPYLLFKNSINYGYSATILAQQKLKNTKTQKQQVLGFFPVFEGNYRNLQELQHTVNEEKNLIAYTKGLYLNRSNATKKAFLENVNNYDIIHLSTHASSGTFLQPAHIEFRNKTLYLPEIYGLNLQSNLFVISACETGIGKLQKGEGAMSLARGFSYAGVKNLLVSLWKVNDKATSKIMLNFYKNYKNLHLKSKAIHQAKLDYIRDKNIRNNNKTPYYWSSFVFIGNNETNNNLNLPTYYWLICIFIFLLTIYFINKHTNFQVFKSKN